MDRYFFLSWHYVLNQHIQLDIAALFIVAVFFKKAAIIIAILGQKVLQKIYVLTCATVI